MGPQDKIGTRPPMQHARTLFSSGRIILTLSKKRQRPSSADGPKQLESSRNRFSYIGGKSQLVSDQYAQGDACANIQTEPRDQ